MKSNARHATAAALILITMTSGSTATSSLFVIYRERWGITSADIAYVFTAYVGTLLPTLLFFGGLSDRLGRRVVTTIGIALMALGLLLITQAHELRTLIVARFFQGAGVGLSFGGVTAAFTEAYRGKLPQGNALQSITAVGLFAGPLISAVVFNLGGGLSWSFVPGLLCTIALLFIVRYIKERPTDANTTLPTDEKYASAVVGTALRYAMPLVFVSWAGLSLFLSLVPAYLAAALHLLNPLIGAGALVATQISSLIATLRLGNVAPESSGVFASITTVLGLACLVAGTSFNFGPLVVLATLTVGAGVGVASAAAFGIATRVGRGQRARVFARMYIAAYLGYSVPTLALGWIALHTTLATGFVAVIILLAVVTAALPLLGARERTAMAVAG